MSISFSEGADQKFKVPGDGVILGKILHASTLNYLQNSPNFFFPRAFSGPCSGTAWCLHSYCQAYSPVADLLATFRAQLLILQIPPNIALVVIDFTNEGYYRVWKTVTKQCYETE